MIRPALGWLLASVCCSSVGHLSLKLAARGLPPHSSAAELLRSAVSSPWLAAGIGLHVLALALWVMGLRRIELSIAYPFLVLGLVMVSLLSWAVLDERPAHGYWLGFALIIGGVVVVATAR